ncbi:MAG: cobalt transporter [Oscillatoria sp. PMC 1051.18]|nr:cobalt transporter [Oscillatoria sp. PMC 1051.18]
MKSFSLVSLLSLSLTLGAPSIVLSHVGHGDEFQATGGINRVEINAETDGMLGIEVTPIAPAADGSSAVTIPVQALVDADGKQLVFVQYENFYEPVEVTTGATQGEMIEITEGLSVGEKLVTQGSLSLYAESRKTQTADAETEVAPAPSAEAEVAPSTDAHAQADAEGVPHSHDNAGNMVESEESKGFPAMATVGAIAAGLVVVGGAIAFLGSSRKKKSTFSNK